VPCGAAFIGCSLQRLGLPQFHMELESATANFECQEYRKFAWRMNWPFITAEE
jgi:hypothetical protein